MWPVSGERQRAVWHWIPQRGSQLFVARKRCGNRAVAFVALFMGAVFGSANHANAGPITADASASWFWQTKPGGAAGLGQGSYSLGENKATAGTNTNTQPQIMSTYAGQAGLAQMSINPSVSQDGAERERFLGNDGNERQSEQVVSIYH